MRDRFENHLVLGNYFGVTMSVKKVRAHTGKRQKQAQKEHAEVCGSPANSKLLTKAYEKVLGEMFAFIMLPSTFHTECYFNAHKPVSQLTAKGKAYGLSC